MNKTLTRLFTVALLMMVSMGARAEVKVLFGEKGTDKYEGKGGTIQVKQEESRDGGKVTVRLAFIPDKNYTFDEQSLEVYKVFSPESSATRALEIDGDALKLEEDKSTNPSEKHYHVDIESKLALRVKEAQFINMRKSGDPITVTYHIINLGRLNDSGQLTDNRTEALQFTVTGENLTVGVPDKYKSPLAKNWVYYSSKDVTYDTTNKECTFIAGPSLSEGDELSEGDHVYVAYELDEDAFSTVGLNDGGIYRIKFPNNFYLKQDKWGSEINTSSANVTSPTSFEYLWKFNIVDPYQITIQSQSSSYTNYYLSSKTDKNDFADIRLQQTLSAAQGTKAWAFSLLPGETDGTYRLIVTDGSTVNSTTDNRLDSYGHGYLNNNRKGNKTTYHLYYQTSGNQGEVNSTAYARCDLTIESLNANYTYNIVDTQGHIAIKYTVSQPMGSPLRGYEAIPAAIRSPYIEGETVTFYSSLSAEGSRDNLSGVITNTPLTGSDGSNIFVAYTNTQLRDKPLHLRGQRGFQMQINGEYVYENSGSLGHTSSTDDIDAQNYKWKFTGQDPYRVRIQNAVTGGHYLNWNISPSATLSLDASSNSYFILFGGNVERPGGVPSGQTDQIELMAANGADVSSNIYYNVGRATDVSLLASNSYPHEDAAIQVLLKADEHTMNFYIIDKSGHIVIEESGSYQDLVVPEQWQSPLVSDYHFYKLEDFTISNGVYTLNGTPAEIPSISEAPNDVYVTYDISDAYDLDGSENRTVDGKKYLLKFAGGTTFYQEKGDGFESTAAPGIYPYINGEGGLFVYGQAKLDATVDEVGSTRTRWAWYLEGGDPYRLRISSLQTRTDGTTDDTHYSYLRTYMPQGYDKVVTGVISNNSTVYDATDDAHAVRHKPTDYMILKGTNGHFRLVTTDVVDDLDGDATNDVRQTVTSFENYWKTNPTAANVIHDKDNSFTVGNIPTEAQITTALTTGAGAKGWHSYNVWANGSTWTNSKKTFDYGPHWFQTISVGTESDGTFNGDVDLVEYHLDGALILLDQHGWEVMRKPITNRAIDKAAYTAAIKKYDSPMVRKYHFWTNFTKESGYHKYKPIRGVSSSKDAQHKGEGASLANYPEVFSTGTLADIYVTYEVMATYRNRYTGADTEEDTNALPYLIKQGTNYAKTTDGENISTVSAASVTDLSSVDDELLWKVKPNFNIDTEMGYHYDGNENLYDEKTQAETESDYYNNDDPTVYDTVNGQNGFDPYNLQIESVKYPGKLFTINATDAVRDGSGGMQSTYDGAKKVTLKEYAQAFTASDYYDIDVDTHTGYQMLHITNSTFMAINDGHGNIRLMPRFDHQNVETAFTILDVPQSAAPVGDNGSSTQTTLFIAPITTAEISSSDQIIDMNGNYVLSENFEITRVVGTAGSPFTGTIDGKFRTIDGADRPLIGYAQDATIKNVILEKVDIDAIGNVGAIANETTGSTRIYNCGVLGGSVTSSDAACGGLVGHIASDSNVRVVNCYNYATVSGSTYAAGIVGWNEGTVSGTTTVTSTGVRIANCMMYGKITSGTNRSPVYCGNHTNNQQKLTEYNFWRSRAYTSDETAYTVYNDQLAIGSDEYLYRFPFYRHILNTHREMAAYFLFADHTDEHVAEIGHWVLNTAVAPYPIIESWKTNTKKTTEEIAWNLPNTTDKGAGKLLNSIGNDGYYTGNGDKVTTMGSSGYLSVSVNINGSSYTASLPITDMNEARYDYTWGKVVLPHANEFEGWTRDYDYVCTGWKITSVTKDGSVQTTFSIPDNMPYNFADRDNPQKDIYDGTNNPYVFAQGGNYIVPYGVTAISIEAHFAKAYYLSDPYSDVGYKNDYSGATDLGWKMLEEYHGKTVYTNLSTLVDALKNATNPNDQAIVLVGNFHHRVTAANNVYLNNAKAVTIMSCDEDNNQEPDYAWYMGNTFGRMELPPIRFDVPNIEIGMAARVNGSSGYPGVGIWHVHGWFELTENSLNNSSQFEINSQLCNSDDNSYGNNRWIANSGCFVQVVRCRKGNCSKLSYMQVGGNAYIKELYPGSHTDDANTTTTVPIAVTGGQVDECYMTGYKAGATLSGDMIRFYGAGGKIKKFLGSYLENPSTAGVTAKIDHANIGHFFGGGTSAAARIKGNIDITINNSKVDFYCGGPEFGDMDDNKTLTTHAIGTTFGKYYGAGFGGTSITYNRNAQTASLSIVDSQSYDLSFNNYTNNRLTKHNTYGIGTCYKFEFIYNSNATSLVTRFYTGYAQFSLATTGNVTNTLSHCTFLNDFYGAGCQGKVKGTVTSTLTDCTVQGSAYGGGYQAESNEVEVYPTKQPTYSVFTKETGLFSDFGEFPTPDKYTWVQGTSNNKNTLKEGTTQIYTDVIMSDLGNVTGAVSITVNGGSVAQDVFGGGNESKSLDNTTVTLQGNAEIFGNVYGGGNQAQVSGSATVNIQQ